MRRRVHIRIPMFCVILITLFTATGGFVGSALGDSMNQSDHLNDSYRIGNGFINGEGEARMTGLLSLLQEMGLDISYGPNGGTVFSMVDQSLTRIITDLSSGNTEGFEDVPIIQETLKYLGISTDDIIVRPDDIRGHMDAIDRYNEKYSTLRNYST